jgi:fumarate hydratase class II
MTEVRIEFDSMGAVEVPADKLWGAQTQRSLQYFSIGRDLIPGEMILAYAILKRSVAIANHAGGRLEETKRDWIVRVCDELLAGQHRTMFPPARLDDGQWHPVQYECQRGHLELLLPACRHGARQQDAGSSK